MGGAYHGREQDDDGALRLEIPPNPRYARWVRERVAEFGLAHHAQPEDIREFVTAIGEALANAIEHAPSSESIVVTCRVGDGETLLTTVEDAGGGFSPFARIQTELPSEYAERGRGLPIMRRYTDIFEVRSRPGAGTRVTLGRFLRRSARRVRGAAFAMLDR